jgi:Mlc titration factor MtfA (ptsG expression regulator)
MIRGLVLLAGAVLLGGGFLLLRPLVAKLLTLAIDREEQVPIPAEWPPLIERRVAAVRALTSEQRKRLLHAVRDLITTRHWEGCGGLVLTPEMQLVIAAQACLLTLELPGEAYPSLKSILIYPSTFVAARAVDLRKWTRASVAEAPVPELGEAWNSGTVVVAWDAAVEGGRDAADGQNVVLHEFAHLIDYQFGLTGGGFDAGALMRDANERTRAPSIPGGDTWRPVLAAAFERHYVEIERGTPTLLGAYAATNDSEFFAVATEVFFEKPAELLAAYPDLYQQLAKLFRQDPAHNVRPEFA